MIGGLLLGLSALGKAPGAYQEARGREFAYGEAQDDAMGKAAFGNALRILGQGDLGGGTPGSLPGMPPPPMPAQPPPPGQGSQPMQQGPPSPQGPPPQPPGPGPSPGTVNPAMVGGQQQNLTGPIIPPGGTMGQMPQQPPRSPPSVGGPGGAPPGMGQSAPAQPGGGTMSQPPPGQWTLPQLAQAIQRANPGIQGRALFAAMQHGSQMLAPFSKLELRQEMMQQHIQELQMRLAMQGRGQDMKLEGQREGLDAAADRQDKSLQAKSEQQQQKTEKSEGETSEIVKGITSGSQPPVLTGLYGKGPAVRAGLEKAGFDLGKAQLEWKAAERQTASLNGPQITRFNILASTVDNTIDHVKQLADQMKLKNIPLVNQLELQAYIQAQGDTPNSKLAVQYMTAVNGLKEEFANLANGGYAPTAPAWKLANEQINGNYSVGKLSASLDEVQRLIRYRMQALQSRGSGGPNRYEGQGGGQAPKSSGPKDLGGGWSVEEH